MTTDHDLNTPWRNKQDGAIQCWIPEVTWASVLLVHLSVLCSDARGDRTTEQLLTVHAVSLMQLGPWELGTITSSAIQREDSHIAAKGPKQNSEGQ